MQNKSVRFCKTCLMPNTRPRIQFDQDGICNACHNANNKKEINWDNRKDQLSRLIEEHRSKHPHYDCIVPWSGGKDSSSIALRLKKEMGLNPLLVTFSPLIPTEIGNKNREALLNYGFDSIYVRPNQEVSRYLSRRFFVERGNPKVHWDAGVNSAPVRIALELGIPLIFYAEHGESEYGGHILDEKNLMIRDLAEVLEHQIGDDPNNWISGPVGERELFPYLYPDQNDVEKAGIKAVYFGYFFPWDVFENFKYVQSQIEFHTAPSGRTCGTFTDYDSLDDKMDDLYYYMQFIKFGFGRCARDSSRLIYRNKMTRAQALDVTRLYDGEFPKDTIQDALDYMKMNSSEFEKTLNQHREEVIWEKKQSGEYVLRNPIY